MLLGFYAQLADALEARKEITDGVFIDQLRAFLAQGQYIIFYRSRISYTNTFTEHGPEVIDGRIELLGRIADLLAHTADLEIQRVTFYALRTTLCHNISPFFGTKANSSAETASFKVIDVMLDILTRTSWVVRHSVVELMVDLLELGKSTLNSCF